MARGIRLTRRALAVLAVCLGLATAGHGLVLAWWDGLPSAAASPLRTLADPLFTRMIAPADPPADPRPAVAQTTRAAPPPGVLRAADSAPVPAAPASSPTPTPAEAPPPAVADPAPPAEPAAAPQAVAASAPAPLPVPATPSASTATATATATASAPAPDPAPDTWPPDARLTYRLEGRWRSGPLHGSARVQWQRQGTRYQAQVDIEISPFVHRTLTSQGEATPQGLLPRVYEERSRSRRRAMQLGDTDITLADGRTVPRPEGVQDTASQFVELGHRFATGRQRLAMDEVITLPLARPGGVDTWTYDVIGQEQISIPRIGEVTAWRLRPRPMTQRRDNISAEIWFAPSLRYLPVRIRLTLGDEAEIDLKVENLEQR